MKPAFFLHVRGARPHLIDHWTKPYKTLAAARAQATRNGARDWRGQFNPNCDWVTTIYLLNEQTLTLELVERDR